MARKRHRRPVRDRLRRAELRLLVDAPRWLVIVGLAAAVYLATVLVGVAGPVAVREYLLGGTSVANAYIELQPGIITAITIVLGINQLVLSPEFGSIGRQRRRLEDALEHRRAVEETASVISSPTDPVGFLRTVIDGTMDRSRRLSEATTDAEPEGLREQVSAFVDELEAEIRPVSEALADRSFREIEMVGAAIHYDTAADVHRLHDLRRTFTAELSTEQEAALDDLQEALNEFVIAREYFRTRFLQSEFIRFSRMMLYTGLPAVVVAHFSVGVIGPNALPGSTLGVRNLLWFEAGTFTVTMLPVVVIVGYVARIVTLAETSIFVSPFAATDPE